MGNYDRQLKTIIIMLFVGVLTALLGYALRIYIARNYSVSEYGMVYATLSFFMLIMSFMDLGVSQALVRDIAKYRSKNDVSGVKSAFMSIFFFQMIFTSILSFFLFLFSRQISTLFLHSGNILFFKLLIVWFLLMPLYTVCVAFMYGYEKPHWWSYTELFKMVFVLAVTLIFEFFNQGILSVALGFALVHLFIFLIFYSKIGFVFTPPFKIRFNIFMHTLKYGILITLGTLGWTIFAQSDTLIITYMLGIESAAMYQIAVPIATLLTFFITPITATLYSSISSLWFRSKKKEIAELCSLVLKFALMMIMPVLLTLSLYSSIIIRLLFGERYIGASASLVILAWAFSFILFSSVIYSVLSAIGQAKKGARAVLVASLVNILGCIILVRIFGIAGAAISTLLSGMILLVVLFRYLRKFIEIDMPFNVWIKTMISGSVFVLAILLFKNILSLNYLLETVICLLIASVSFVISLFVLKVLSASQINYIKRLIFSK